MSGGKKKDSSFFANTSSRSISILHKPHKQEDKPVVSEVARLKRDLLAEDETELKKIKQKMLEFKKEVEGEIPKHKTTRLVDRKDKWFSPSWHMRMEELCLVERDRRARRKLKQRKE